MTSNRRKKKPGQRHEHRWILQKYENGHWYYKCFCGLEIVTERQIKRTW